MGRDVVVAQVQYGGTPLQAPEIVPRFSVRIKRRAFYCLQAHQIALAGASVLITKLPRIADVATH